MHLNNWSECSLIVCLTNSCLLTNIPHTKQTEPTFVWFFLTILTLVAAAAVMDWSVLCIGRMVDLGVFCIRGVRDWNVGGVID